MTKSPIGEPGVIPLRNDGGGYVRFTGEYVYIKFAHRSEELEFRVNALALWNLLKTGEEPYVMGGLEFFVDTYTDQGIKMTGIEIMDPKTNFDWAIVSTFDLKEKALYYFVG
jgi:hypothetical protein